MNEHGYTIKKLVRVGPDEKTETKWEAVFGGMSQYEHAKGTGSTEREAVECLEQMLYDKAMGRFEWKEEKRVAAEKRADGVD